MNSVQVALLLVCLSTVVLAVALIVQSWSLRKHLVIVRASLSSRLLEVLASISGTVSDLRRSLATMSTSQTSSSENLSLLLRELPSQINKERSHLPNKSENTGVIYFGRNSPGCPTCNTLLRWEVMHSKLWLDMPQSLKPEEVCSLLISNSVECRSWQPTI